MTVSVPGEPGSALDPAGVEPARFPRMLIPAACSWIAAAACCVAPEVATGVAITAFVLAGVCIAVALLDRSRSRPSVVASRLPAMLLLAACCAAPTGLVATAVAVSAGDRQPVELRSLDAGELDVELVITADGVRPSGAVGVAAVRFSADLVQVTVGDERLEGLAVPVMVFWPTSDDGVPRIGERWKVSGTLRWNDPGDARSAMLFAHAPATRVSGPPAVLAWSSGLRAGLVEVAAGLPGAGGELLPGLAFGDTGRVSAALDTAMQQSSLSHLTAVSGANCAVIVWLVWAAAACLGAPRGLRVVLALIALAAFVVLVTPQPSVQRAALMAAVVLVLGGFGRPTRGLAALALATIALLVADPWLAGQYGFGLSVLATAGLLLLSRPIADVLGRWLPRGLATAIAVPAAAQLACQPMLVLLDPTIQLGGVPANLLAGPAAAPATLIGLVACLMAAVSAPLGTAVAWLGWVPATWIAAVAQWFAALPATRVPWPEGALGVIFLTIPTGTVVLLLLFRRSMPAAVSRALGVGLLVSAMLVGGRSVGAGLGTALHRPADWIVAACDVGQGDAVLVRSGDAVALVDVGPDPAPLQRCLDDLGIGRIGLLVLTHYDLDHVGGIASVVGRVDEVLLGPVDDPEDERIAQVLADGGASVHQADAGLTGALGDGDLAAPWRVLWPDPAAGSIEPGNDASVVVRFDLPAAAVLLLGDLGEAAQDRLLARHGIGSTVDIAKVSHHGSADQSERLARRLDATVALVSVGADNGYGHPTQSALELYEQAGATPVRTDRLGTILIAPNAGGGYRIWSELSGREPADQGEVGARR